MFTGLIEAVGTISSIVALGEQSRLTIEIPFAHELGLGDSVAVNGCCLTVARFDDHSASFDLLAQTMKVTSLGDLCVGAKVNLERALLPTTRLGGHFVQGHVDDTGKIIDLSSLGQDHRWEIFLPPGVQRYCIDKGSIAVDGISLTIAELQENSAVFWITPHTYANTHLADKKVGQRVNLESDLLAKYAARFSQAAK